MRAEVTEHQLIEQECGCGYRTKATVPASAAAPMQYEPRIAAVIVYLHAGQFLSKDRTVQALAELFGIPMSSGTVAALTARAAGRARRACPRADRRQRRRRIRRDRVPGLKAGRHGCTAPAPASAPCSWRTLSGAGRRWRRWALPRFTGVAVHDAWAPYDTYTAPATSSAARALRELQAIADAAPLGQWCWATQSVEAISQGRDTVDPAALAARVRLFCSAVLAGPRQTTARSGTLMKSTTRWVSIQACD